VRFQPSLSGTLSLGRTNSFFLGGGRAMLNALYQTAEKLGVRVWYDAPVTDLEIAAGCFRSAVARVDGRAITITARSMIAAAGGFESNIEWLKEYWGAAAENFLIRGTPYNRGDVLKARLRGVRHRSEPGCAALLR
jgi:tricarballylate dehydrogenase